MGVKHDSGKIEPVLVLESMALAIAEVCKVGSFGAQKYSRDGWFNVPDGLYRYRNAKHRHMLQGARELIDAETGIMHAAHEAWNALAVLELMLRDRKPVIRELYTDADEQRAGIIGQNGNEGEHYEYEAEGHSAAGNPGGGSSSVTDKRGGSHVCRSAGIRDAGADLGTAPGGTYRGDCEPRHGMQKGATGQACEHAD